MKRLRELSRLRVGYTIRRGDKMIGGVRPSVAQISSIISHGEVDENSFQEMECKHVPKSAYLKQGDILFGARGASNRAGVFRGERGRAIASGQLLVITLTTDEVDPSYLAWYINRSDALNYFKKHRRGSHVQMISKEALGDLPVPVPSRAIQEKIVELSRMIHEEHALLSRLSARRLEFLEHLSLDAAKNHDKTGGSDNG